MIIRVYDEHRNWLTTERDSDAFLYGLAVNGAGSDVNAVRTRLRQNRRIELTDRSYRVIE